jgi:hypothetical protein
MLWGIAIADTRVAGHKNATVEIKSTQLTCRVEGTEFVLNKDSGAVRGGYIAASRGWGRMCTIPCLSTIPNTVAQSYFASESVLIAYAFWGRFSRAAIPRGHLEGCRVKIRAKISQGALLQVGFDYWRDPIVGYGPGGNNREAGASNWYFPSPAWQEATFSDIKK